MSCFPEEEKRKFSIFLCVVLNCVVMLINTKNLVSYLVDLVTAYANELDIFKSAFIYTFSHTHKHKYIYIYIFNSSRYHFQLSI